MEFIWNDGGRAASGFVGLAGDCVVRALSIATGAAYRDVYKELGEAALKSPRDGVPVDVSDKYLRERGWVKHTEVMPLFDECCLPKGILVVHISRSHKNTGHLCAVIDHVVHDTWDASQDHNYALRAYWTPPAGAVEPGRASMAALRPQSAGQELTQNEFEKILRRLRALDNTASNSASTEGEKHNALRMMQDLMLRHNLTRDDIIDDDNVESVQFTRQACPLNSQRAYNWQVMLGFYVTHEIFPMVQWFTATRGHRTLFWFYGPRSDVENCIALFRELVLTIATSATLHYGGYSRGSGASYAEGYVSGLPRGGTAGDSHSELKQAVGSRGLILTRMLTLHDTARRWLAEECEIRLTSSHRNTRDLHDPAATHRGRQHGASHKLDVPGRPKRLN